MSKTDTVTRATIPDSKCIRATEKGLRVRLGAKGREVWIPRSTIHDDSEVYDAGENSFGKLVLTPFIAEQLGIDLD